MCQVSRRKMQRSRVAENITVSGGLASVLAVVEGVFPWLLSTATSDNTN